MAKLGKIYLFLDINDSFLYFLKEALSIFLEGVLHLVSGLGRNFQKYQSIIFGEAGALFVGYFAIDFHIALVADDNENHFRIAVHFGLLEPSGDIVKGFAVGDIVDEDGACSGPIVSSGD